MAIGLFSGAGGLEIGLQAAGFKIELAVESDEVCCQTLRANHDWKVLQADLTVLHPAALMKASGLKRKQVDLIAAGPPCQPFSKSANWSRNGVRGLKDPRASVLENLMMIIGYALPRCVVIENVDGFRRGGLDFLLRRFDALNDSEGTNYRPVWRVVNAADYGVPQLRRQFILVAFRDGTEFHFPDATHKNNYLTCWDAIGSLAGKKRTDLAPKGRWGGLLPSIPEGQNYLWHTNRGGGHRLFGWRTKYWSFLLKLAKNKPAWTIAARPAQNAGPFHWSNRQLSTSELLRLQTIPKDIFIAGTRVERQRQIGNAVPSLLAEVIGRSLICSLVGKPVPCKPLKLAIRRRKPLQKSERITSPSVRYLHMIGNHRDHPGTGRGPAPAPWSALLKQ